MLVAQQDGQHREVVWNDAGGVTGGGVSVSNPRAPWQSVQIQSRNPHALDGRVLPDVSALAGLPLYSLLLDGAARPDGGTSAATPLWASLIARIDAALPATKRQRFLPPLLYKPGVHTGFHDIDWGKNVSSPPGIGYEAHAGFDAASGWGVPDGKRLLDALTTV
jgi:kumamolisin